MASLPQMSATLGTCISWKIKMSDARPCIAQIHKKKKNSCLKGALFPLTLVEEKKPKIGLRKERSEKWKVGAGESGELVARSVIESIVKDFHRALNDKNMEELQQLISDDCEYQDYLFYSPYKGQVSFNIFSSFSLFLHFMVSMYLLNCIAFDNLGECDQVLGERYGSDGSKYKNCCARYQRGRCRCQTYQRGQTHGYSVLAPGYLITSLSNLEISFLK